MKRLLCYLIGHDAGETLQDGCGAAWHRCTRCGAVTHGAHLAVIAAAWIVAGFFAHLAFGLLRYGWRLL